MKGWVIFVELKIKSYRVGGWALDHGVCWWLVDGGTGNVVLVSDLDGAGTSLDGAVSDDSVLDVGPGDSGSGVDLLGDVGGAGGVADVSTDDSGGGSDSSDSTDTDSSDGSDGGSNASCWGPVSGGSSAQSSAESSQNLKKNPPVFKLWREMRLFWCTFSL